MTDIKERGYVTYEDFGAVGDGVTDDFVAIYKAHEYANENKLPVKGTPGKTYYIHDTSFGTDTIHVAVIKTDVDWCGANFIIDDTDLTVMHGYPCREMALSPIFRIEPDDVHAKEKITDPEFLSKIAAQGLNQKTKKIDLGLDWNGPVMIIPYNSAHRAFRRRSTNQYNGAPMHEIIVVEEDGSISCETPIMFSYSQIDYMDVYRLDPNTAITVENAVFTTRESRVNHCIQKDGGQLEYIYNGYIFRGIHVKRSYTTVRKIEHRLTGGFTLLERAEKNLEGAMYTGFYTADYANHVTFKDCIIPGRTSPGLGGGHSSYGFKASHINRILLDGCFQPNFWVTVDPVTYEIKDATAYDENAIGHATKTSKDAIAAMGSTVVNGVKKSLCWGLGGTNYCKNMHFVNSTLTRYDAHAGLYNGRIANCNISGMELTGVGKLTVENTNWYQYSPTGPLLHLRGDYGFHWSGDIVIKNVNAYVMDTEKLNIAHHNFVNWYFGYSCAFPNIDIDNLKFFNQKTEELLPPEYNVNLFRFTPNSDKMHLDEASANAIFAVNDDDGDGYIDEPRFISDEDGTLYPARDLDGDGRIGNTSLKYDEYMNAPSYLRGGVSTAAHISGAIHPTCKTNLNKTRPPRYFRVVNNERPNGEVYGKYLVKDTVGESDGGWYRDADTPDTMGGFFGGTEFIYGVDDGERFIGTENKNQVTKTFYFKKEYDA